MTSDAGEVWKRWRLGKFMESDQVKGFFGALICVNAIVIAVSADLNPEAVGWFVLEIIFVVLFSIETFGKMAIFKGFFWTDSWNVADLVIVLVSLLDLLITMFTGGSSSGIQPSSHSTCTLYI